MMVVIIVSRRVGQVTLLVSERTSCRNLNGLTAIVEVSASVVRRLETNDRIRTARRAQPSVEGEADRLAFSGVLKPRGVCAKAGPLRVLQGQLPADGVLR